MITDSVFALKQIEVVHQLHQMLSFDSAGFEPVPPLTDLFDLCYVFALECQTLP